MHQYSLNTDERLRLIPFLALASVVIALILYSPGGPLAIVAPWWLDAPSVMALFALLYYMFDRTLWRLPILRTISLIETANLNGNWNGALTSHYSEPPSAIDATLQITQTWTKIRIVLSTTNSQSYSIMAAMEIDSPTDCCLRYQYQNIPRIGANEVLHWHTGTATLNFDRTEAQEITGEYYSGRGRQSMGSMRFARQ